MKASVSIACLYLFSFGAALAADRKTDVVHLNNGDRITGEIKAMQQGELTLSTKDVGTATIKWEAIARIESDKYIEFELKNGTRVFGTLPPQDNVPEDSIFIQTLK